jgi:hypothetical protein
MRADEKEGGVMVIGWRKFLAFIIACILVYFGKISDQVWLIFGIIFIGGNIAAKFIPRGRG